LFIAKHGDYYRLLIDGDYMVTVSKKGYQPLQQRVTVRNALMQKAQDVDFVLKKDVPRQHFKFVSANSH